MDFVDADSQHVFDLRAGIEQNENYSMLGLPRAFEIFQASVEAGFRIIGGVALTVSLFASKIPDDSKGIMFLNSPIAAAIMLALLIGAAVCSAAKCVRPVFEEYKHVRRKVRPCKGCKGQNGRVLCAFRLHCGAAQRRGISVRVP